jgi:hypothetical protein
MNLEMIPKKSSFWNKCDILGLGKRLSGFMAYRESHFRFVARGEERALDRRCFA